MPTHQGKTQTDIVIGDGGDSASLEATFEFTANYGTNVDFQYQNNAPSGDAEDSSYELKLLDATGGTLATFAAEYTCDPVTGTATNVSSTRRNAFKPSPNGSSPSFPTSWSTHANRTWSISSTKGGSTFAGFDAEWKFASTTTAGYSVSQTVVSQTDSKLEVTLEYSDGAATVLTVAVVCRADASATAGVTLGSPSVSDTIQP